MKERWIKPRIGPATTLTALNDLGEAVEKLKKEICIAAKKDFPTFIRWMHCLKRKP